MNNNYLIKFYNKTSENLIFIKNLLGNLKIDDPKIIAEKYDLFNEIDKTLFFIELCIDNMSRNSTDSTYYLSHEKIKKLKYDILTNIQDESKIKCSKKSKKNFSIVSKINSKIKISLKYIHMITSVRNSV